MDLGTGTIRVSNKIDLAKEMESRTHKSDTGTTPWHMAR